MIIRVLCDDRSTGEPFSSEHGLSLLIQTNSHCVLFDAGQSDLFLKHAETMGVSIENVDTVVLSHGHYDHGGGLTAFLRANQKATVYARKEVFGEFYHGTRYIGLNPELRQMEQRFRLIDSPFPIDEELLLLPAAPVQIPPGRDFVQKQADGTWAPDLFQHEQYLLVTQENERVLFTGCAHRGILAVADLAAEHCATALVGGFHLSDALPLAEVQSIVMALSAYPMHYYTGHCTGSLAYQAMQELLAQRLHPLGAGHQFVIGSHAERARFLFRLGYNCSQSVFGAFAEELGMDLSTAMKLSCSFGGGMGRLREVCGAVSGMLMVCGMKHGYATPETGCVKAEHYRLVQQLANTFREQNGSIICRELLGGTVSHSPIPTERTPEFYRLRPCERLISYAAELAEQQL